MLKVMADNRVEISAKQDGALYSVALDEKDFIIEGLGNEFSMSHVGLVVSVESGEALVHGRHITSDDTEQITLPANSSGYLVLRIDLTQAVGAEIMLYATPTLTNEEINWDGSIYDFPIATFITSNVDITNFEDVRVIHGSYYPHKLSDLQDDINVVTESRLETYVKENIGNRTRRNITTDLSRLSQAIAEQNLEKYGYTIGDYFNGASGYTYHLADMDTYYGGYNSYAVVSTHHCGIVVDTHSSSQWNASGSAVRYDESTLQSFLSGTVLTNIRNDINALFGDSNQHLIAHEMLANGIGTGGWSGANYIRALSEVEVYSTNIWSADNYQQGEAVKPLTLFQKFRFNEIFGNTWFWLRSLSSASTACYADNRGFATYVGVSYSGRVVGLILFK